MKKLTVLILTLLAVLALPTFAYADVAAPGLIVTIRYLPYILAAVVVIVVAVLISAVRRRRTK